MPFLLGAFGAQCNSDHIKKLSRTAELQATEGTLQTIHLEHGILFAGYKPDENYHYDHIIPLPSDQGMLVGKLFDRAQHKPARVTNENVQSIINDPAYMSRSFWGRYVGAFFNKTTKTVTLVRDPQGLSTLFYLIKPDGIIFATELALLYEVLEVKPAIDLHYFGQHLIHTNHALKSTPFEGIEELLPGMALKINAQGQYVHELFWNPSSLSASFIVDEHSLEEELLATFRACTKAWVGDTPGVCVELSGGTDSSGLMLLLHDLLPENKKLMAVNYIDSKTQSSNEIEYAQETADACNAPLYFIDWQTASLLDKLPQNFFPNRPSTLLLFRGIRHQLHELAQQHGCPEIMNGQGGDHVFLAPPPKLALADYWLTRGIRGSTKPLKELCGIYRMPLLALVHENIKAVTRYYRGLRTTVEKNATAHLDKDFAQQLKQQDFYLNAQLKKIYPGKAAHIEAINHAVYYSERNQTRSNICITHPLLSQPVVEIGLKIPIYQSFQDGYDRILFRRAISRIQKTKSLWRRIKGHTTGSMIKQCAHHAHDIRDIILNGKLAACGMINTRWADEHITKMQHGQVENLWPMLHILTSELWFNQWRL